MKIKNYCFITLLAKIDGEALMSLYALGNYPVIMYVYPLRTRIMKYNNALEAKDDFIKRTQFLAKTYKIEFTEWGKNFINNPNYVWGIR